MTTTTPAARVSGTIKALEWGHHPDAGHDPRCDEHYGGKQSDLTGKNEYDIYPHPCADGLYVLDVMGSRTGEDFPSVEAAKSAAQSDYEDRILAAIQPDPEPQLLDETSLRARIGDISNQVHNLACRHQNDEDLSVNLGELSSQLWALARIAPATPSSAGMVSVETAGISNK